jgi:two-component system response regulator AtoC
MSVPDTHTVDAIEDADRVPLSVLVVDDDRSIRSGIAVNLRAAGYLVREVEGGLQALDILHRERFDILLCDLRMPGIDGFEFIARSKAVAPQAAVIMMTGFGNQDLAIRAIRAGADDYLAKPFEVEELLLMLRKLEELKQLRNENAALRSAISQKYNFSNIIAHSEAMKRIFETVKRLANFNTTVLVTGESGTGKELLARAIHHNSPRRGKSFVAINCGAIPEHLMESELFGHRKGAFTDATRDKRGLFEEASGGTIFLDEIGEMPLHLQVKILRALQEQQIRRVGDEQGISVDVRVIAATLRNLEDDVKNGRFRDDLYYRLNVVSIRIPPLRERPEDITVLIEHLMQKHSRRLGITIQKVAPDAMRALMAYHWKGNVRELENCLERAMVLTEADEITMESLPDSVRFATTSPSEQSPLAGISDDNLSIKQHGRALEINLIERALRKTNGNRTHAAKILEISHRALLYKLKEYNLAEVGKELEEVSDS